MTALEKKAFEIACSGKSTVVEVLKEEKQSATPI